MGSRLPDEQCDEKVNALVSCWSFYFVLFCSFLFSISGRMKGHVLSVFGYLVLQFTYCGVLLGFFFPLFHFFCAHHELSFARVRVVCLC